MGAIIYIPLMLATLALILTSFLAKKRNRITWIIVSFVIWLMSFVFVIFTTGVFD